MFVKTSPQRPGEQIRLFFHRLKAAHTALIARQKVLNQTEDDEASLVQQLIVGLQCPTLSRYLQEKQKAHDQEFRDIRDRQEKLKTEVMAMQREQSTQISNLTSAMKELAVGTGRPDRRMKE